MDPGCRGCNKRGFNIQKQNKNTNKSNTGDKAHREQGTRKQEKLVETAGTDKPFLTTWGENNEYNPTPDKGKQRLKYTAGRPGQLHQVKHMRIGDHNQRQEVRHREAETRQ